MGGNILIASASLLLALLLRALLLVARPTWPDETYRRVAALTVAFVVPYTVFSEWLNTEMRGSCVLRTNADRPGARRRLSPLAQWIVIPIAAFRWARPPASEGKSMRVTQ